MPENESTQTIKFNGQYYECSCGATMIFEQCERGIRRTMYCPSFKCAYRGKRMHEPVFKPDYVQDPSPKGYENVKVVTE